MGKIEDLLRRRMELLNEIDEEIRQRHTREVTLLFTDIVGSTRYYAKWGDIAGRQLVQTHNDLLFPFIEAHRGWIVKTIGDSIMASFDSPLEGLQAAVEMQGAIAARNVSVEREKAFHVRMGLHHGAVMYEATDLFGDVVNSAARVQSLAGPDEVLVSDAFREAAKDAGLPLVALGPELLRGREEPLELFAVDWQGRGVDLVVAEWRRRRVEGKGQPRVEDSSEPVALSATVLVAGRPRPPADLASVATSTGREMGNPYLNRVMIANPLAFVGRRATLKRVFGRIGDERPQSVALVGERRIGKSSLLNQIKSPAMRREFLAEPASSYFAYVDLQRAALGGAEGILEILAAELCRQTGLSRGQCPGAEALRAGGEALAEAGCRLVFLLDEFEAMTRDASIGPDFYGYLRSLANGFPMAFVTASSHRLRDLCATKAISDSPFFNIFSTIQVGLFARDEALALVEGPSAARGIPLAPLGARILDMAGTFPFFLQIACANWYDYLEGEGRSAGDFAGEEPPREVLAAFREDAEPHFAFILDSLAEGELAVLAAAAGCGAERAGAADPVSANPALAAREGPGQSGASLESLLRKGYLMEGADGPIPFGTEFARYVAKAVGRG